MFLIAYLWEGLGGGVNSPAKKTAFLFPFPNSFAIKCFSLRICGRDLGAGSTVLLQKPRSCFLFPIHSQSNVSHCVFVGGTWGRDNLCAHPIKLCLLEIPLV